MTITMEVTREALIFTICNWRPLISGFSVWMTQVAPQEELQVLSALHRFCRMVLKWHMTCQATSADWYGISLSIVSLRDIAQVDKVLEQIKTILAT